MDRVSTHSGSPRSGCADIHRFAQLLYRIHPPKTDAPKGHKAAVRPQSDRLLQSLPLRPCRDWNRKPAPERYSQRKAGAEWPKQLRAVVQGMSRKSTCGLSVAAIAISCFKVSFKRKVLIENYKFR